MAPLIGKDMSEAIFLERFAALCVDPLFHVRKVCAANFGDFSNVVGSDSTEQILVSNYIDFMQQKRFYLHNGNNKKYQLQIFFSCQSSSICVRMESGVSERHVLMYLCRCLACALHRFVKVNFRRFL